MQTSFYNGKFYTKIIILCVTPKSVFWAFKFMFEIEIFNMLP